MSLQQHNDSIEQERLAVLQKDLSYPWLISSPLKESPITSQMLLLKICSFELNRAIFIYLNWWFVVNDSNKPIFYFTLQKTKPTNQNTLTETERILYWRHYCACGTGSNTWAASSVGAAGRVAEVAPRLEGLQK